LTSISTRKGANGSRRARTAGTTDILTTNIAAIDRYLLKKRKNQVDAKIMNNNYKKG